VSRAALLLSGGMDSVAIAYMRRPSLAITIDYGQLAAAGEIRAASAVADALGIRHVIIRVDLRPLGSGDMVGQRAIDLAPVSEWWPFRNQMLMTLASMRAINDGICHLLIGSVKDDRIHADGTREFIAAMDTLVGLQEGGMTIEAHAIELTTVELIRKSEVPTEILAWAHSCHVAQYACGVCRGCYKHYRTCEALGVDPY